jgi:hypothetical protein
MPDARASIEKHYGSDGLVDRIIAALEAAGRGDLTVKMLNLVDQMQSDASMCGSSGVLLKLIAPLPPAYVPVTLADSPVKVGSRVIAAGYGRV